MLGRIPANRLYQSGMNILNWWPAPNVDMPVGQAYNFESTDPKVDLLGLPADHPRGLPAVRRLRGSVKFLEYQQPNDDDCRARSPGSTTRRWTDYGIWVPAGDVQLDDESDDVLRGVLRRELPSPGRLLDRRRRAELLPATR